MTPWWQTGELPGKNGGYRDRGLLNVDNIRTKYKLNGQ